MEAVRFSPGDLVEARGREWVVLPSPDEDILNVRPLSGSEADAQRIALALEVNPVRPARFAPPTPERRDTQDGARLLADALRLSLRRGAGPFRSAAHLGVEPRAYQLVPLMMALKLPVVRLLIADDVGIAATAPDQKAAAEYGCPKGTNLRDEITRYFRIGQAHWQAYARLAAPTETQTTAFVKSLLMEAFGFEGLRGPNSHQRDGHTYRISLEAKGGRVPIVVAAPLSEADAFTKALPQLGDDHGGTIPRRSPSVLLQDWLNANAEFLWGLVFAGDRVRLMRDNASFTRPAYIEADLGAIFRDEMFADFTATWLLIHATRFGGENSAAADCALERWREAGLRAGTAARDRLGKSVKEALLALGQGFLDANPDLRVKLDENHTSMHGWFEQLLRVVYRLIFLAVAEDRELLHGPDAPEAARDLYTSAYGFSHMRDRSARRSSHDHHHDAWEAAKIVFRGLERSEKLLGLPALGGLFTRGETLDLDDAKLPNRAFLRAIFHLSWLIEDGRRVRVNWRDMATEELGSVYEGLLELVPIREEHGRRFGFAKARQYVRKVRLLPTDCPR